MNKSANNTRPRVDPRLRQRHAYSMQDGTSGTNKTKLLEVLATMMKLSVKELIQRYKLS